MTAALAPYVFDGMQVRISVDADGEPWFFATDVCVVLGLGNSRQALTRLAEDEKGVTTDDTLGGPQERAIVSEAGLYRLIFTSRKTEAESFRRWVSHDVLPTIRRTGFYGVAPALPDISTAAGVLAMAEQFAETARALVASEAKVAELEPKADLADTFLIADKSERLVREAAKLLSLKERDLRAFLLAEKLIYTKHARCGDVQYDFYAAHAHHFTAKEKVVDHQWGSCSHYTLLVTARGIELIRKRLRDVSAVQVAS